MQTIKQVLGSLVFCLTLTAALFSATAMAAEQDTDQAELRVENQVNINTADAETLAMALDGVGMTRAQDIVEWREQNGDFESVEQLQQVRGIGPATLERNRDRILLQSDTE